ncbi:hypothetical protein PCE1_000817 [Barthelona sp. PCE]
MGFGKSKNTLSGKSKSFGSSKSGGQKKKGFGSNKKSFSGSKETTGSSKFKKSSSFKSKEKSSGSKFKSFKSNKKEESETSEKKGKWGSKKKSSSWGSKNKNKSEESEESDVCLKFLKGDCQMGSTCGAAHLAHPFTFYEGYESTVAIPFSLLRYSSFVKDKKHINAIIKQNSLSGKRSPIAKNRKSNPKDEENEDVNFWSMPPVFQSVESGTKHYTNANFSQGIPILPPPF